MKNIKSEKNKSAYDYEQNFRLRANKVKAKLEKSGGKKITYQYIADHSGLPVEVVARVLNGSQKHIRLREAIGIASSLQTSVSYLAKVPDADYILDHTRLLREYLKETLSQVQKQREFLLDREKGSSEQLNYIETTLNRIDVLNEH
jgi:DNA-directed RNA polymerase sigma subunit (sigma70/sigma32)